MESDHAILNGQIVELSAQQLLSCTYRPSRGGCRGGRPEEAIQAAVERGGLMLEQDYPYTASSPPCQYDAKKAVAQPVSLWYSQGEALAASAHHIPCHIQHVAHD